MRKNYFTTWLVLSDETIRKHLGKFDTTVKGYQTQIRQNIRSTRPQVEYKTKIQKETYNVYATVMTKKEIFTDLKGKFPIKSSKGIQ